MLTIDHYKMLEPCPNSLKDDVYQFLKIYDMAEGTIHSIEFEYIYIIREYYSYRQLSQLLNVSVASLYRHIKKIRKVIILFKNLKQIELEEKKNEDEKRV